ncbi:MAG: ankyrin repeat domain-containing protein [Desulfococcaceae bacterium]
MNRSTLPTVRLRPLPPILLAFLLLLGGCADLHESVRTGKLNTVRAMLENGVAADETDPAGTTPLMVAARMGDGRLVGLLLKHGADIDRQNRAGQSALSLAWEHGRELTFRTLLDRGAAIHFEADVDRLPPTDRRRGLWRMAREERLFRKIAADGANPPPERFDEYFERFPDGRHREEVVELLARAAREDLAALGNPPDADKAAAFLRDYGAAGSGAFEVTASRLNIRSAPTTRARIVGHYAQGEAVRARETRADWLRTDQGWISRAHVRPTSRIAPELGAMLQTARAAARGRSSSGSAAPKSSAPTSIPSSNGSADGTSGPQADGRDGKAENPRVPASQRAAERDARSGNGTVSGGGMEDRASADPGERRRAEHQLATVMKTPTLKGLEAFVLAYKDRSIFDDLVARARDAYRELLLREVSP